MQNQPSAESAQQLEAAQQELAGLLYAISHDVRAPLRSIAGFTQALQEHLGPALDETAQRYLQRIQQANQKLAVFIEGLLSLSRITHAELHRQQLDLTRLCDEACTVVRARYPQQPVSLELQKGMQIRADAQLLKVALEHLLDNAWKATAQAERAHIAVSCVSTSERALVTVRDNGVGFDMVYATKLFVPFQHLHAAGFSAGLGLGLATAQRIVLKHGGRMKAEAQPHQGAAFHLDMPLT